MESRTKVGLIVAALMILISILFSWYITINKVDVYIDVNKDYLSDDKKLEKFGISNIDTYKAYYEENVTVRRSKSLVPFVYNYDIVNKSERKLFTIKD